MALDRHFCNIEILIQAVRQFRNKRILVVGDVMLDRFIWGSVSRISPEAPVPVVEIKTETICLGGAANVAANIRSLGGNPIPLGVIGRDHEGSLLREKMKLLGAPLDGVIADPGRATSVKTRILAHHQQVCRTDREDKRPLDSAIENRLAARFQNALRSAHAVVISDYAKGMISPSLLKKILPCSKAERKIVCIDPKSRNMRAYRPATVITPNVLETELASGIPIANQRDLVRAGKKILAHSGIEHLLVTRGEEGMALFEGSAGVTYIPTVAREVFDVTGAGDTVISTLSLGLVSGLTMLQAAVLANIAAGIVVGKLGTASVTPEELIASIRSL